MKKKIGGSVLELTVGDIVKQKTEAVVNAANKQLAPGGGVAGAIHKAAGPGLWEECKKLGGCETGEAKITSGHNLKSKYIIHTVGPVYKNRQSDQINLKKSYLNSLKLATQNNIKSISFPAISSGIFGYPKEEASKIALETIIDYLKNPQSNIEIVRLVLYNQDDFKIFKETLDNYSK
ncbi:MAG TPA: macro domain-containing protein [Thermoanaerobacterales bacterium]|nr:macro domain-containing protein [Thermoanaerobacterales bacterium]